MASKLVAEVQKQKAEPDMTPMIDCVFLLIIFFLCIEFRSLEAKLAAYLPKDLGHHTTEAEPVEKIDVRIVCPPGKTGELIKARPSAPRGVLVGHQVVYEVGAKRVSSPEALRAELSRLVKELTFDPQTKVMKPRPMTIHAYPNVTYGDVTQVVDLAKDIGFEAIHFGGGRGPG
jgi:biopolymer transport protein ExbD